MTDEQAWPTVNVVSVELLGGYRVRLMFDDGATVDRDLYSLLRGPAFATIRQDPAVFAAVTVDPERGVLCWPGGPDIDAELLRYEELWHAALTGQRADRPHHQHRPADHPVDCAIASLFELAGADLTADERTATLEHGLTAVDELERRVGRDAPERDVVDLEMLCSCSPEGVVEIEELTAEVCRRLRAEPATVVDEAVKSLAQTYRYPRIETYTDHWSVVRAMPYRHLPLPAVQGACDEVSAGILAVWRHVANTARKKGAAPA